VSAVNTRGRSFLHTARRPVFLHLWASAEGIEPQALGHLMLAALHDRPNDLNDENMLELFAETLAARRGQVQHQHLIPLLTSDDPRVTTLGVRLLTKV